VTDPGYLPSNLLPDDQGEAEAEPLELIHKSGFKPCLFEARTMPGPNDELKTLVNRGRSLCVKLQGMIEH